MRLEGDRRTIAGEVVAEVDVVEAEGHAEAADADRSVSMGEAVAQRLHRERLADRMVSRVEGCEFAAAHHENNPDLAAVKTASHPEVGFLIDNINFGRHGRSDSLIEFVQRRILLERVGPDLAGKVEQD